MCTAVSQGKGQVRLFFSVHYHIIHWKWKILPRVNSCALLLFRLGWRTFGGRGEGWIVASATVMFGIMTKVNCQLRRNSALLQRAFKGAEWCSGTRFYDMSVYRFKNEVNYWLLFSELLCTIKLKFFWKIRSDSRSGQFSPKKFFGLSRCDYCFGEVGCFECSFLAVFIWKKVN